MGHPSYAAAEPLDMHQAIDLMLLDVRDICRVDEAEISDCGKLAEAKVRVRAEATKKSNELCKALEFTAGKPKSSFAEGKKL